MHEKYQDDVEFFMVYIREAHPTDGWQARANEKEKVLFQQPTTVEDRASIATQMCTVLKIKLPPLVDAIDDRVGKAYSAWPDRLYLIGQDGHIVYKSGRGPRG